MLPLAVIGTNEIILILLVVVLLFGAKRIPEWARGLREGMNEFKKASKKPPEAEEDTDAKKLE